MTDVPVATSGSPQAYALQNRATLRIPSLYKFEYNCVGYSIPEIRADAAESPTPFANLKLSPSKVVFGKFPVTFLLDQNLSNWAAIFKWLRSLGRPESFAEYKYGLPEAVDGTFHVFNQSNSQILQLRFSNMIPVYLSPVQYEIQVTDPQPLSCQVVFEYDYYDVVET